MKINFKGYFIQKGNFCQHWITLKFLQTHLFPSKGTQKKKPWKCPCSDKECAQMLSNFKKEAKHPKVSYFTKSNRYNSCIILQIFWSRFINFILLFLNTDNKVILYYILFFRFVKLT